MFGLGWQLTGAKWGYMLWLLREPKPKGLFMAQFREPPFSSSSPRLYNTLSSLSTATTATTLSDQLRPLQPRKRERERKREP